MWAAQIQLTMIKTRNNVSHVKVEKSTTKIQDLVSVEEISQSGQELNALLVSYQITLTTTQNNVNNVLKECTLKEALISVSLKVDFLKQICVISIFSEFLFI